MGRDAQTLSTKNYARNSAPLVPSQKNVARRRANSWARGLRPEGRRRQHRRGRSAACVSHACPPCRRSVSGAMNRSRGPARRGGRGAVAGPLLAAHLSGPGGSSPLPADKTTSTDRATSGDEGLRSSSSSVRHLVCHFNERSGPRERAHVWGTREGDQVTAPKTRGTGTGTADSGGNKPPWGHLGA